MTRNSCTERVFYFRNWWKTMIKIYNLSNRIVISLTSLIIINCSSPINRINIHDYNPEVGKFGYLLVFTDPYDFESPKYLPFSFGIKYTDDLNDSVKLISSSYKDLQRICWETMSHLIIVRFPPGDYKTMFDLFNVNYRRSYRDRDIRFSILENQITPIFVKFENGVLKEGAFRFELLIKKLENISFSDSIFYKIIIDKLSVLSQPNTTIKFENKLDTWLNVIIYKTLFKPSEKIDRMLLSLPKKAKDSIQICQCNIQTDIKYWVEQPDG